MAEHVHAICDLTHSWRQLPRSLTNCVDLGRNCTGLVLRFVLKTYVHPCVRVATVNECIQLCQNKLVLYGRVFRRLNDRGQVEVNEHGPSRIVSHDVVCVQIVVQDAALGECLDGRYNAALELDAAPLFRLYAVESIRDDRPLSPVETY